MLTRLRTNIWFFFYYAVAKRLPHSYARWGGPVFKAIRQFLGRRILAHCGNHVNIESGADFGRGNIVWLGDYSDIGIDCKLAGEVHIGNHSFMGPEVVIWTANHAFDRIDIPMMFQGCQESKPVWIGNDVWIGTRVIILSGVKIGDHAVIGAGAVVTKEVPEWAVVAGSPAKIIRFRIGKTQKETCHLQLSQPS